MALALPGPGRELSAARRVLLGMVTTTAAPAGLRDVELVIAGMTCAACAVRIEKKLNRLDEVSAAVSYATGTAPVTAPASCTVDDLVGALVLFIPLTDLSLMLSSLRSR